MNKIVLLLLLTILFFLIPFSFAEDNETADLTIDDGEELSSSSDYYFNASVENDGSGSVESPYKYLTYSRIKSNSNIHLADGEYKLERLYLSNTVDNVVFTGESSQNTVINYISSGSAFKSYSSITFVNLTLIGSSIESYGVLTAKNTNFINASKGNTADSRGGAIYSNATLYLDNCSFVNNDAGYGGAIYLNKAALTITNSEFTSNSAYSYGGAIAAEDGSDIKIENSSFKNCFSQNDAGGALYIRSSFLTSSNLNIVYCNATFGGALCLLSSSAVLSKSDFKSNTARYDGGVIYSMYGNLSLINSSFINNSALNGGALFASDVSVNISLSNFTDNNAGFFAGALYLFSCESKFKNNLILNNHALIENNTYSTDNLNLSVLSGNYTKISYLSDYDGEIPSSYMLKDTSVKNQYDGGNCWAFAGIAALESAILKATGVEYDLSEENMKNLMGYFSYYGWNLTTNDGGYDDMAIGYLTSWLGPVNDSDDSYDDYSTLSPVLKSIFHVQNIAFLKRDDYTDNNEIKEAILKYGGVATGIYWNDVFISRDYNYYCPDTQILNHAVVIVGWDDNYSSKNFKNKPSGNGAWIVKNSWGSSVGKNGYFYVSYYDTGIASLGVNDASYVFILNDSLRLDKNYQYDIQGKTDYFELYGNTVWYKNNFISTGSEYLAAVSTYFERFCNWDLSVMINNQLKLTQSGYSTPGYYTIYLNELLHLDLGDSFTVVFKISHNESVISFPISENISLNKQTYSPAISFFSLDGNLWIDLYEHEATFPDHFYISQVACIKAFSLLNPINTTITLNTAVSYNKINCTASVFDENNEKILNENVVFNINGKNYTALLKNGTATFIYYSEDLGDVTINASFSKAGYVSSNQLKSVEVDEIKYHNSTLTVYDSVVYGNNINFSVTLKDYLGNPIENASVKILKHYSKTDENGVALFNLTLACGTYKLTAIFEGNDYNIETNSTFTIKLLHSVVISSLKRGYNSDYDFKVTFLNADGSAVSYSKIIFYINSKSTAYTTDFGGVLTYAGKLNVGKYELKFTNPNTNETLTFNLEITKRITGNTNIKMYYGAKKYYKIRIYDDNGNPVSAGVKVKIKVGSKTYTLKTDKNAYVKLKISLKAGSYTIKSSYKGYTVSNKLKIKAILKAKNISKKSGKVKFKAKLLKSNGKALKGGKVTFKFKGKKYKVKTNKKGVAVLKLKNLKKGKYKIYSIYGKSKIKNTIKIKS